MKNTTKSTINRPLVDRVVSSIGLLIAIALICASVALFWTHNFIHSQVSNQLTAQKISFPAKDSTALTSLPTADRQAVSQYADMNLTTGAQAEVFADHYVAVHLQKIGNGKTYSELSAMSMADPSNQALTAQVNTVFKGEMLRGVLLNAYAFDTMALVAYYAACGALAVAILLAIFAMFGFRHAKRTIA
jgi:hypothetical protein